MDSMTDRSAPAAGDGHPTEDGRAPQLPPGPRLPRPVQGVGFGIARRETLRLLHRRYGTAFTVHLPIY